MGALRKAGVWLGLIEDDEDRNDRRYDSHDRHYDDDRGFADFDDEYEDDVEPQPVRSRAADRADRSSRGDSVRPIGRVSVGSSSTSLGSERLGSERLTHDNLALAPQVQLRERALVAEDRDGSGYRITTLHPTTYNEARTIGEHFREGVPVIINLSEMDESDAKRLVDFAAGLAFGLRGTIERVTNRVFLLSPANVQVTAEDKARIAEGGFFNQS